jgi:hypothetical protein
MSTFGRRDVRIPLMRLDRTGAIEVQGFKSDAYGTSGGSFEAVSLDVA